MCNQPDPMTDESPIEDDAGEVLDVSVDDVQLRLWLKATTASVQALATLAIDECRVRYAVDQAVVSACERISRLCRSDLAE